MSERYDVIIVGLGSMGSAAAWQLAKRGLRVLGLEQFSIPHSQGAHHGHSRVTRTAYFEHQDYVPLLQRSFDLWRQLEADAGQTGRILHLTGGLYMGPPDGMVVGNSRKSAERFNLPHAMLTRDEVMQRYPFVLPEDWIGMTEEGMGFLVPELAVSAFCEQALRHDAHLLGHTPVTDWTASQTGVTVTTPRGRFEADQLLICGGAWSSRLLAELNIKLTVTRQTLLWVWPKEPDRFAYGTLPTWNIDSGNGAVTYGFPMMPSPPGFKLALHAPGQATNPDTVDRTPNAADEATVRATLANIIPEANGQVLSIATCLYTYSPDGQFIIDRHPNHSRVTLACGFSGHGFKFASVIGESLADLVEHGRSDLPIDFLSLKRLE